MITRNFRAVLVLRINHCETPHPLGIWAFEFLHLHLLSAAVNPQPLPTLPSPAFTNRILGCFFFTIHPAPLGNIHTTFGNDGSERYDSRIQHRGRMECPSCCRCCHRAPRRGARRSRRNLGSREAPESWRPGQSTVPNPQNDLLLASSFNDSLLQRRRP